MTGTIANLSAKVVKKNELCKTFAKKIQLFTQKSFILHLDILSYCISVSYKVNPIKKVSPKFHLVYIRQAQHAYGEALVKLW